MRHKYADQLAWALMSTTSPFTYTFSCNNMYDPNITGIGHQPHYFDQMLGLGYNRYCVVGSKIVVRIYFGDITYNQTPVRACLFIDDTAAVGSKNNANNMIEDKGSVYRILPAGQTGQVLKMSKSYSARKYWGAKPLSLEATHGYLSTSPAQQAYYGISCLPVVAPAVQTNVVCEAFIYYTCVWYQVAETGTS